MAYDRFTMIEFHKIAAQNGDGFTPQFLEIMKRAGDSRSATMNPQHDAQIIPFPERAQTARPAIHRNRKEA